MSKLYDIIQKEYQLDNNIMDIIIKYFKPRGVYDYLEYEIEELFEFHKIIFVMRYKDKKWTINYSDVNIYNLDSNGNVCGAVVFNNEIPINDHIYGTQHYNIICTSKFCKEMIRFILREIFRYKK